MGVTGCGKSEVGSRLADALGDSFIEGDQFHPLENVARMAGGVPLTDADREGWLDAIGDRIAGTLAGGDGVVATCSALKRIYRDRLRTKSGGIFFVHIAIDRETARTRVASRTGHFMPASLVDSQFAILEPPANDEDALTVDGTLPVGELVSEVLRYLRERVG